MKKIISITLTLVFLTQNASFALSPWMTSQSPLIKREIRSVLDKSQVVVAETIEHDIILKTHNSDAVLLENGKYLVSREVYNNPLKLVRAIIHEDIEAVMQIMQYGKPEWGKISGNRYRYNGIKELIFNDKKVLQRYYDLCHKGKKPGRLSDEFILNDIIAKALELMFMADNGFVVQEDYKKQDEQIKEARFYLTIMPILKNRNNRCAFFNDGLFISAGDSRERRRLITTAIDNGFKFTQVSNFCTGPVSAEAYLEELKRFQIYDKFVSIIKIISAQNNTEKAKNIKESAEKLLDLIIDKLAETNEAFQLARRRYNLSFHVRENPYKQDDKFIHLGKADIIFDKETREIDSAEVHIDLSGKSLKNQILTIFHELAEIEVIEILLKTYPALTPKELETLQESGYTDWLTLDKDKKYAIYYGSEFIEAQKTLHKDVESYYVQELKQHERDIRKIFGRIGIWPKDLKNIFGEEQLIKNAHKTPFDFGNCEIEEIAEGFSNEIRENFKNQCLLFAESIARITGQEFRKIRVTMIKGQEAGLEILGKKTEKENMFLSHADKKQGKMDTNSDGDKLEKICLPGRFLYCPEILNSIHLLVKEGFNVIDLRDPSKYYSRFFINKILTKKKAVTFLNSAIQLDGDKDSPKNRKILCTLRTISDPAVPQGKVEIYEPTLMMENENGQKEVANFRGGWVAPGIDSTDTESSVLKELLRIYEAGIHMEFPEKVKTLSKQDICDTLRGIKNKNPKFRMVALETLIRLDKPEYLTLVPGALEDPFPVIQHKAAFYMLKKRPDLSLAPFLMGEILTTLSPADEIETLKGFFCLETLDQIDTSIPLPEEWFAILKAVKDRQAELNFMNVVRIIWMKEKPKNEDIVFLNKHISKARVQITIRDVINHHYERKNGFSKATFGRLNMGSRDKQTIVRDILEWIDTFKKLIQYKTHPSDTDMNIYNAIGCSLEEMQEKDWRDIKTILVEKIKKEKNKKIKLTISEIYDTLLIEKTAELIKEGNRSNPDISKYSMEEMTALIDDLKKEGDFIEDHINTGRWSINKGMIKEYPPETRKQVLYNMMGASNADKIIKQFEKAERFKQMSSLISILLIKFKPFGHSAELITDGVENLEKLIEQKTGSSSLPPGCPAEALRVIFKNFRLDEFHKEQLYRLRTSHRPSTVDMEIRMLKKTGVLLPAKGKPKHYRINSVLRGSSMEETEKNCEAIYNIKLKTSSEGKECPLDRFSIPQNKIPAVRERVKLEILHGNLKASLKAKKENEYTIKMWSGYAVSQAQKLILQKIRTRLSHNGYKIDFGNITDEKQSLRKLVDFAISPAGQKDNTVIILPFKDKYVKKNLLKLKNSHVIFIDYDRRKTNPKRFFHIGGIIAASIAYLTDNDLAFNNICNILTNYTVNINVTIDQLKKDSTLLNLLLDPIIIKDSNDLKHLNERMEKLLMCA